MGERISRTAGETVLTPVVNIEALRIGRCAREIIVNSEGKFTVMEVGRYDLEYRVVERFDTEEEAIAFATEKTIKEEFYATHESAATVYYPYTPKGDYLDTGYEWGSTKEKHPTYLDWQRAKRG